MRPRFAASHMPRRRPFKAPPSPAAVSSASRSSGWLNGTTTADDPAAAGRKTVVVPEGAPDAAPICARDDPALVEALARAFRDQRLLDEGRYASISEMATAEGPTGATSARCSA
jgi:hypothetical protein